MNQDQILKFLASWAVNSIFILLLSELMPSNFGFGNTNMPGTMAAVSGAFIFTLVILFVPSFLRKLEFKLKDERTNMLFGAVVLAPIIWAYKTISFVSAFGISNNFFILIPAIFLPIIQFYVYKYSTKFLARI